VCYLSLRPEVQIAINIEFQENEKKTLLAVLSAKKYLFFVICPTEPESPELVTFFRELVIRTLRVPDFLLPIFHELGTPLKIVKNKRFETEIFFWLKIVKIIV